MSENRDPEWDWVRLMDKGIWDNDDLEAYLAEMRRQPDPDRESWP